MKKTGVYYLNGIYYNLNNEDKGRGNMNNINFQFSIFGKFSSIEATMDNIMKLMEEMKIYNFLPSTITNKNIDIDSNKIVTESRISFVSQDQSFNFRINNDRIDFNYDKNIETKDKKEYEGFITEKFEFLEGISNKLFKVFNIRSNRFAINTNIIGDSIINNKEKEKEYFMKNIVPFSYYNDKNVFEWNYSSTARDEILISEKKEPLNIITTLNIATNTMNSEKRLLCHFDVNTSQNEECRFTKINDIKDFFMGIKPILIELFSNFKDCDENE